jgi:ubiquinone/menaquinone biosynthesis C-methylase UbiE
MPTERDYVLGTHDEELARLGLQHDVWRAVVLDCWQRAGIIAGSRVLDVGAGPGYAAVDLAEIVGPTGEVVALERSSNFVRAMEETCRARSLTNVKIHELDLMTDDLPISAYDFSWCRWVASFVTDRALLIKKLAGVMRKGSVAIFHEYAHYLTWRFSPRLAHQERFAREIEESWRAAGGEANVGLELPPFLVENDFVVRSATPRIFCLKPSDDNVAMAIHVHSNRPCPPARAGPNRSRIRRQDARGICDGRSGSAHFDDYAARPGDHC